MDFGRRLTGVKPTQQRPVRASTSLRSRLNHVFPQWKMAAVALAFLIIFYSMAPLHFSTGEKCHSVLKGLRNNAFSHRTREFSLARCQLETFPEELYRFKQLRQLDLADNLLSDLPADLGERLPNLEVLFLSRNKFSGVFAWAKSLAGMSRLRMVAFRDNELTEVPDGAFPESVEWLILTSNRLRKVGRLPKAMRKLMLSNNELEALPTGWESMEALELLRVANNRLPQSVYESVATRLPNVKWLAASDNPTAEKFETLPGVKEFVLTAEETSQVLRAVKKGRFLGEGSAGKSFVIDFKKEPFIFKQYKGRLSSDGRIESEIALIAAVRPKSDTADVPQLQQLRGITLEPLGALYRYPKSQQHYKAVGKPPSLASCTRDTYDRKQTFAPKVATKILVDIAKGAKILHSKQVVHGDLYAHNMQYDRKTGDAMLIDLGAAWKFQDAASTALDFRAYRVLTEELGSHLTQPHADFEEAAKQAEKESDWDKIVAIYEAALSKM